MAVSRAATFQLPLAAASSTRFDSLLATATADFGADNACRHPYRRFVSPGERPGGLATQYGPPQSRRCRCGSHGPARERQAQVPKGLALWHINLLRGICFQGCTSGRLTTLRTNSGVLCCLQYAASGPGCPGGQRALLNMHG